MKLLDAVPGSCTSISVVGMAKNAGKTVTLNRIIEEAYHDQVVLGLTSIGRDGERQDIVTKTEKPMIYIHRGTYIATAEVLYHLSEVKLEIVEITTFQTSLGKVIIAKALEDGYVQLGGPTTNQEIKQVGERMKTLGCQLIIVDGALDRVSSASPSITDACILSSGAVLSRKLEKVVEMTAHQVSLFNLPEAEKVHGFDYEENQMIKLIHRGNDGEEVVESLALKTALNAGHIIGNHINEHTEKVIFPGALVNKTIRDIIGTTKHYKNVVFVVKDATRIFIEHRDWLYYQKLGIRVNVATPIKLLAVTVNPYAPLGYFFEPDMFLEKTRSVIDKVPVYDVMDMD